MHFAIDLVSTTGPHVILGYNTNGWAHHAPEDALAILAELGYGAVGITLDHHWLNPFASDLAAQMKQWRVWLRRYGLRSAVETGARFLLDARHKHEPTLVSPDAAARALRGELYRRAIDIAAELESDCVSLWSGIVTDGCDEATAWKRLCSGLGPVLDHALHRGVLIGFEPEPGMFIDTLPRYAALRERLPHPTLRLTLDIGHLHCQGETPLAEQIRRYGEKLVNIHIEDMRARVHEHLQFGEGEIDFPPVLTALRECGYAKGVYVELSRHSHCAPTAARRARDFLTELCK